MARQPPILPVVRMAPLRAFLMKLDELETLMEDLPPMDEWQYHTMMRQIEAMRSTVTAELSTVEQDLIESDA